MKYTLKNYREQIDIIDDEIALLLEKRLEYVREISKIKKNEGKNLKDIKREKEILVRLEKKIKTITPKAIKSLWKKIFEISYSLFS